MASYFRRILRQCEALWPAGPPQPTAAQWNTLMDTLLSTGTATLSGVTFTLTAGLVAVS